MTRENKLALVVGFGLLLLVGILVSDHFSASRSPLVERFAGNDAGLGDPGSLEPLNEITIVDHGVREGAEADAAAVETPAPPQRSRLTPLGGRNEDAGAGRGRITFHPPEEASTRAAPVDDRRARPDNPADVRRHQVARGESLSSISDQYYGTTKLWRALARYNEIDDPDRVPVGRSLRIPARQVLDGARAEARTAPASVREPDVETYTVRESETLSDLARRFLGSGNRWRELYRMNEDRIDDPDRLLPGTRIRVPRQST